MLLNPAPVAPVPQALLDKITYLTPNEHEAATLFAGKGKADILDQNQGKVIMTLGSKGVAYAEKGQVITVPGFKVKPVDTTGAGDTFNGAFAVARAMQIHAGKHQLCQCCRSSFGAKAGSTGRYALFT